MVFGSPARKSAKFADSPQLKADGDSSSTQRTWWKTNASATLETVKKAFSGNKFLSEANKSSGATPLHVSSAFVKDIAITKYFIEGGADVNAKTYTGWTPLFYAASNRESGADIIKALVEAGADVNATDKDSWTALFAAVHNKNESGVKTLIDCGVNRYVKDRSGMTAYDHCIKNNFSNLAEVVKSYAAGEASSATVPQSPATNSGVAASPMIKSPNTSLVTPAGKGQSESPAPNSAAHTSQSVIRSMDLSVDDDVSESSLKKPDVLNFSLSERNLVEARVTQLEKEVKKLHEAVARLSSGKVPLATRGRGDKRAMFKSILMVIVLFTMTYGAVVAVHPFVDEAVRNIDVEWICRSAQQTVESVTQGLSLFWNDMGHYLSAAWGSVTGHLGCAWDSIMEASGDIAEWVRHVLNVVRAEVETYASWAAEHGREMVNAAKEKLGLSHEHGSESAKGWNVY